MAAVEDKYNKLRKKLDEFGYHKPLSFESLELVEKLVSDLLHYQNEFNCNKILVEELAQQYNLLKMSRQPLEQKYENICEENNNLNLQLIQERDAFKENERGLKVQISKFEKAVSDLESINMQYLTHIGKLEEEILLKNRKLLQYEEIIKNKKGMNVVSSPHSSHKSNNGKIEIEDNLNSWKVNNPKHNYVSDIYTHYLGNGIADELEELKSERSKLMDMIGLYKKKISARDKEIKRLHGKFEKKISSFISNTVCKCHIFEENLVFAVNEDLKNSLEVSRIKCHSLMGKTIDLVRYIKILEKKIEDECIISGKIKTECSLYKRLCQQIQQLQTLNENCLCKLRQSNEIPKISKTFLTSELSIDTAEDPFEMVDVENNGSKREVNGTLNKEPMLHSQISEQRKNIKLISKVNTLQKKLSQSLDEISILKQEIFLLKKRHLEFEIANDPHKTQEKYSNASQNELLNLISGKSKNNVSKMGECKPVDLSTENQNMKKYIKDRKLKQSPLLEQTVETCDFNKGEKFNSLKSLIEKVTAERDYYRKEYHCLQDKVCQAYDDTSTSGNFHHELAVLHQQNMILTDRLKKEEDVLRSERKENSMKNNHLLEKIKDHEKENNLLNLKFQEAKLKNNNLLRDINNLQKQLDSFQKINDQLESQNSNMKIAIRSLEEEMKLNVLSNNRKEHKIICTYNKFKVLESDNDYLLKKLSKANSDLKDYKAKLFSLEKEKDLLKYQLDEKAVKICEIEKNCLEKDLLIRKCEEEMAYIKTELSRALQVTDIYKNEIAHSKTKIEQLKSTIDDLTSDNRKLLTDLKKNEKENCDLHSSIQCSEMEVIKLKKRLQVYVDEVRRVEELLEAKEEEREKLLEQFKSLVEATESDISNKNLGNVKKFSNELSFASNRENIHEVNIEYENSFDLYSKVNMIKNEVEGLKNQVSSLKNDDFQISSTDNQVTNRLNKQEYIEEPKNNMGSTNQILLSISESSASFQNERTLKGALINEELKYNESNSFSTSL